MTIKQHHRAAATEDHRRNKQKKPYRQQLSATTQSTPRDRGWTKSTKMDHKHPVKINEPIHARMVQHWQQREKKTKMKPNDGSFHFDGMFFVASLLLLLPVVGVIQIASFILLPPSLTSERGTASKSSRCPSGSLSFSRFGPWSIQQEKKKKKTKSRQTNATK